MQIVFVSPPPKATPAQMLQAAQLTAAVNGIPIPATAANAELVSAATTPPQAPAPAPATPWYSKKIAGNFTTGEAGILAVTAGVLWRVFA